jgi:hypothetical protein
MGRTLLYFLVGLGLVGAAIFGTFYISRGSHVQLTGSILKVRTLPDGTGAIVFADFRVVNPSAVAFVVDSVEMSMETPDGEIAKAVTLSKSDVEKIAKTYKLIGPQYNDVLAIKDKLAPVETTDRMAAGRFNFPPKFLNDRKTLRLRIVEADGVVAEIVEKSAAQ